MGSTQQITRHRQLGAQNRGYKYQCQQQTNNFCKYEALKDGMAFALSELRNTNTYLEVRGDSNVIIEHLNGFVKAVQLQQQQPELKNSSTNLSG